MSSVVAPHAVKDSVTARATDDGITIEGTWIINLSRQTALNYVRSFQTNPQLGFYLSNGRVSLSHGFSRIFMTRAEADAIVRLIRERFGPL